MNLAFDSRPVGELSGVGRYSRCLLEALRERMDGEIVETHKPRASAVDLYHSPWLEGALLHPPLPMVVTMHDAVPLRHRAELLRNSMRLRFRYLALTRAERVITPTRAIADQVIANLDVTADHIEVVPEAAAPVFAARDRHQIDALLKRRHLPDSYLLWVGDMSGTIRHRAVSQLIAARRELPLVLVGPGGKFVKCDDGVFVTGDVSDDELAMLYCGAQALVCPVDEDGFGLPVVEAQACGTPVFAYDTPAMREVLGDGGELFAVDEIEALVRGAEAASRSAAHGGSDWTWDDVAAATLNVYESVRRTPAAAQRLMSGSGPSRRRHRNAKGGAVGEGSAAERSVAETGAEGSATAAEASLGDSPSPRRRTRTKV